MSERTTREVMEPLFAHAKKLPFNIAPERGHSLATEIFSTARWQFRATGGKANFRAYPDDAEVHSTFAGLASLWCLTYVACHFFQIAAAAQRAGDRTSAGFDIGLASGLLGLGEYLAYARSLFGGDKEWPALLQTPDVGSPITTPEGQVNNVFFGALSWILLHEIGHVHLKHEYLVPADQRIRAEYAADDFATKWVLDEAGSGLTREFRVLSVCVALAWLFLNEATIGRGADHPPAFLRFREAARHFDVGDRSPGIEFAGYLFKAIFDPLTQPPAFDTPKEAFSWVTDRLDKLFPR